MATERQKAEELSVSAFVVIFNPQREILLRRRRNQNSNQAWDIPGYKNLPPGDPKDIIPQLLVIETGLEINFKRMFYAPQQKPSETRTSYYYAELNNQILPKFPDQSFEYLWISTGQVDDSLKLSGQALSAIRAASDVSNPTAPSELRAAS